MKSATVSKPSAAEKKYMAWLGNNMQLGLVRCAATGEWATERHHPRGPLWETRTVLKAHDHRKTGDAVLLSVIDAVDGSSTGT
jgi:hypothetical protein